MVELAFGVCVCPNERFSGISNNVDARQKNNLRDTRTSFDPSCVVVSLRDW